MVDLVEPNVYKTIDTSRCVDCEIDFDQVRTIEDLKDIIKAMDITFVVDKYDQTSSAFALYTRAILVEKKW